jgi:AcrR family transcriptional regulator
MVRKARSDASENLRRILDAAEVTFAEHGFDVPLELVAARARVSRMTLYRNFPDREALAFAIFERNTADLKQHLQEQAGQPDAYLALLCHMLQIGALNVGLAQAFGQKSAGMAKLEGLRQQIVQMAAPALALAKKQRQIRADLRDEDLFLIMDIFEGALGKLNRRERLLRANRTFELICEGLKART